MLDFPTVVNEISFFFQNLIWSFHCVLHWPASFAQQTEHFRFDMVHLNCLGLPMRKMWNDTFGTILASQHEVMFCSSLWALWRPWLSILFISNFRIAQIFSVANFPSDYRIKSCTKRELNASSKEQSCAQYQQSLPVSQSKSKSCYYSVLYRGTKHVTEDEHKGKKVSDLEMQAGFNCNDNCWNGERGTKENRGLDFIRVFFHQAVKATFLPLFSWKFQHRPHFLRSECQREVHCPNLWYIFLSFARLSVSLCSIARNLVNVKHPIKSVNDRAGWAQLFCLIIISAQIMRHISVTFDVSDNSLTPEPIDCKRQEGYSVQWVTISHCQLHYLSKTQKDSPGHTR